MSVRPVSPSRKPARKPAPPEVGPAPRVASVTQVAEYVGVCNKTVYRWIAAGDLAAWRVGKRLVRVDLNDVDALMRRIPSARLAG